MWLTPANQSGTVPPSSPAEWGRAKGGAVRKILSGGGGKWSSIAENGNRFYDAGMVVKLEKRESGEGWAKRGSGKRGGRVAGAAAVVMWMLLAVKGNSAEGRVEELEREVVRLEEELATARLAAGGADVTDEEVAEVLEALGYTRLPESAEFLAERAETEVGPFVVGGALRANYIFGSYDEESNGGPTRGSHGGTVALDTIRLNLHLDYQGWRGLLEYRWYEGWNAPHTAWIGHEFADSSALEIGLNRAPFGVGPYGAANNWFFNLDYYVGLADNMNVGVKYTKPVGPTTLDFAYYAMSAPDWRGSSQRSARYSYDIVDEGITNGFNRERHQINVRAIHQLTFGETRADVGVSLQAGRLDNTGPGSDGTALAGAVHAEVARGGFTLKSQIAAYHYDVDNDEPGGNNDIVIMGAYDFPYEVATKGLIPSAGASYRIDPFPVGWIDAVTIYNDASVLIKDGRSLGGEGFRDSFQNVLGASMESGKWFNYIDFAAGRGAPFVGNRGDNFTTGLSGNFPDKWNYRLNINLGYYF